MKIYASKTEMIMCGDRRQLARIPRQGNVKFLGERLESREDVKSLGVVFDICLTWESHAKCVSDRCFVTLIGLANAKHVIPREILPPLIDSLAMSQIRYCAQAYGSTGPTVLGKIQKSLELCS